MEPIQIHFPKNLVFGDHCYDDFIHSFAGSSMNGICIIADPNVMKPVSELIGLLDKQGIRSLVYSDIANEPTIQDFNKILNQSEAHQIEAVIGIGGGSILDVAKLLAAQYRSEQNVTDVIGQGKLHGRDLFLACIPTTAGTGSEMSPNAILLDESDYQKKGIISPFLVPDSACIDPVLTYTVPPYITASTGIDAFTHCLEAYANRHANPVTDLYALEGIKRIYRSLETTCKDGSNKEARSDVALGSMYGGMCLGPVNTAAVHALAYPLGGEYHIPHGISNALLLPHVLRANLNDGIERYAKIAEATGISGISDRKELAQTGIEHIADLCKRIGIPEYLDDFHIPVEDVPKMAESAMKVQRLLKNNLHELTVSEVEDIYYKLFRKRSHA